MNGDVIKSFLVGLGFKVDDASMAKFNKSIQQASVRVVALYASIKALAAGIFWSISKISEGFEQMGYEYRIIAPAINKTLVLRRELLKAYAAAGVNIVQTIQASVKFNMALAKLGFTFKALMGSVAAKFFPSLTKAMDMFRLRILQNMPKIQAALEKFINFIFKAFEVTTILGGRIFSILMRIYDFFAMLHEKTDGWSTIIMAVVAAWKLLNLSFLATPLGQLIAGIVALIALWDDFQVWKEGGQSLFDWSSFVPVIDAVSAALSNLWDILKAVGEAIGGVAYFFVELFSGNYDNAFDGLIGACKSLLGALKPVFDLLTNIVGAAGELVNWGGGVFQKIFGGNGSIGENFSNLFNSQSPLGGAQAAASPQTNQNVKQQTSIVVQGSADAASVGREVAGQQSRVNFDMARNLKGATQ